MSIESEIKRIELLMALTIDEVDNLDSARRKRTFNTYSANYRKVLINRLQWCRAYLKDLKGE